MRPNDIALSKVAAPGSAPIGPPPASVRSSPSSPSSGKASMPMMPFSDWKKISASFGTKAATKVGSPMPRLTRLPSFSSRATRLAIRAFSSMAPLLRDQMIDENRGCHDGGGRDHPDRHDVLGLGQDDTGGHGHQGIEVPRRQRISQVADVVGLLGVEESEVGLERLLEKERAPIDLEDLLALLDQRARSGRGQHAAQAVSAGTDTLRQRALGHQLDLDLTGQHLPLGFRVGADMARDDLADQPGIDQLADFDTGASCVLCNDGQVPLALADRLVNETGRRAHSHEAPDHQAGAIGDPGNGLGHFDCLPHYLLPGAGSSYPWGLAIGEKLPIRRLRSLRRPFRQPPLIRGLKDCTAGAWPMPISVIPRTPDSVQRPAPSRHRIEGKEQPDWLIPSSD